MFRFALPRVRMCAAAAVWLILSASAVAGPEAKPSGLVTVLDGTGTWRVLYSWASPLIETDDGFAEFRVRKGRRIGAPDRTDFHFMTLYPPAGWARGGFDDTSWTRRHFFAKYANGERDSRAGGGSAVPYVRQVSLRGRFTVTDPDKVKVLLLSMGYRGGAIVHVNGVEVARRHMPQGDVKPGSPAEAYPIDVYVTTKGEPWNWWKHRNTIAKGSYSRRVRRLDSLGIPGKLLRKGANVLAVEIHAAPYPKAMAKHGPTWSTCGLVELRLQAPRAEGLVPNVDRPAGFQVWNASAARDIHDIDWGDPHEPLRPIRLAGAANGCYTGVVVAGSDRPVEQLRATVGDLSGPDGRKIPASAVRVSYAAFDGIGAAPTVSLAAGYSSRGADGLLDAPPARIEPTSPMPRGGRGGPALRQSRLADGLPAELKPGVTVPVYVTVRVPAGTPPGDYAGKVTVSAKGVKPVATTLEVRVVDWSLPAPSDFTYWCGLIQSPEGVGLHYRVPLYSKRHWELIDRSFRWIAQAGSKVVFLPLTAETEYGNEQSLVVWTRGADGALTPDLTRVEKYVDLAVKNLGKPRFVVAAVWQFCEFKKKPLISVRAAASGEIANVEGPAHGTPESLEFWRPVLTGIQAMLKQRGLADRMLLGCISDRIPTKATVGVFHKVLPTVGWQGQRHPPRGTTHVAHEGGRKPVMYQSNVWGCADVRDPTARRVCGWRYSDGVKGGVRTWLNRAIYDPAPLLSFRGMSEDILLSDRRGQGQIGADFWPPPAEKKGAYRLRTLYSRFPRSRNVGAGNKGVTTNQLLYPGPDGAVPTIRFEMLREGIQECEARIFLEKVLHGQPPWPDAIDRQADTKRIADVAARYKDRILSLLDERTRWQRLQKLGGESRLSWPASGWETRTIKLYELAGEVDKALGAK